MFALYVAATKKALVICGLLDENLFESLFGNIREWRSHGRWITPPMTGCYLPWERLHCSFMSPSKQRLGGLAGCSTAPRSGAIAVLAQGERRVCGTFISTSGSTLLFVSTSGGLWGVLCI